MKKLVVFIGESGSGKTTLITKLVEGYPNRFKRVVTCTSRPMRVGEADRVDYHFFSPEYFTNNQRLVLVHKTDDGSHYGTRIANLRSNTHHLLLTLRPVGVRKLTYLGFNNILVARISISDELKAERMRGRGDTTEIIRGRLQSDSRDRGKADLGETPIIELDATRSIAENVGLVLTRVGD